MKNKLGICDSGIGGILVMNALMECYPKQDMVFIGDQENAPYGDKDKTQLLEYARKMMDAFLSKEIKNVVIACNTLCANVLEEITAEYQQMNIIGILEPTCQQLKGKKHHKVLVMATKATVNKHAFRSVLMNFNENIEVIELACPKLVPLIENGENLELVYETAKNYVLPYVGKVDAVIMGCTHFPLVQETVENVLHTQAYNAHQIICDKIAELSNEDSGEIEVYTTKNPEEMQKKIKQLIKKDLKVRAIQL